MSVTDVDARESTDRVDDSPGRPDVSPDTAFMILKNARRRAVIAYLIENEPETDLDTLAEHLAAAENDVDVQALSSTQRKRLYIGLYQAHLPKMDDANVIDFDKHRGRIELRPEAHQLATYLRTDPDGRPAPRAYVAIAILTVGAVAAAGSLAAITTPLIGLIPIVAVTLHCFGHDRRQGAVDRQAIGGAP